VTVARRHLLVVATFALSVLLYVDRICISAAEGPISEELGLSKGEMGWVMSAFALGYALFQTPSGILADRLGPRRVLSAIVVFWSVMTGLTGAAWNLSSLIVTRLLFGAGEAGAFPGIARAVYSWIPMGERGLVQGINFSGARLGAAFALPAVAAMVDAFGWRETFAVLMFVGFLWATVWYLWFRDDPQEHAGVSPQELAQILATRQRQERAGDGPPLTLAALITSHNLWLLCAQYFASNFTFFFCLTWLFPHLKATYSLGGVEAGLYASAPLIGGAIGNWTSGWLIDRLYRDGHWVLSRRAPAILGFAMAATGLVGGVGAETPLASIVWFSLAVFGSDMTISPSWSVCIDIGRGHAGAVSGTMNMAGNLGSFVTALAFPYLAAWTASNAPFFYVAAALNATAIFVWLFVDPRRRIGEGT
jgi:ACS family glucarate transporter-like MFS transporter